MIDSLYDLSNQLGSSVLHIKHGDDIDILNELSILYSISVISFNRDYTQFAINRDVRISNWACDKCIKVIDPEDYTILPLGSVTNTNKQ